MIKRAPQRVLVPVAAWHSTGPGAARGRLFICQKRPDQDPANRNPYGGERPRQKRDLGRGTDATAMLWMNVVIAAVLLHCFDASHLPLQGTPPEAPFHLPEPAPQSSWPLA